MVAASDAMLLSKMEELDAAYKKIGELEKENERLKTVRFAKIAEKLNIENKNLHKKLDAANKKLDAANKKINDLSERIRFYNQGLSASSFIEGF